MAKHEIIDLHGQHYLLGNFCGDKYLMDIILVNEENPLVT
jgi:hypothetical protein